MTNGRYLPYLEYRDSGVDWLGEIPSHWTCVRLKYVADLAGEKIEPGLGHKYVGMENVDSGNGKYIAKEDVTPEGLSTSFSKGDVLFGKLRPYLAKSWLADFCGICSSEFLVLRSKKVSPRFLNYYTLTEGFINQVDSSTYGSKMPRASWDFVGLLDVPVPANESETIANFLDHETAKIDTLIEKQQQLIKLLKEKRQAVISHAVTKGLNPNAPMHDSGVDWLGEVPAHWIVGRYKFCTNRVVVGIAEAATHAYADTGIPIIRSTNIKEEGLDTSGMLFIKEEFAEKNDSKYLYANDVITVRTGYPGISAVIPQDLDRSQCFTNLVASPRKHMVSEFLAEYLNSHTGKSYFDLLGWGSAQKNISVPILQNVPIAYPDEDEQAMIVKFLKEQRNRYTHLMEKAELQIQLLQERRTALISAAVTGKIDVRDWQAPSQTTNQKIAA